MWSPYPYLSECLLVIWHPLWDVYEIRVEAPHRKFSSTLGFCQDRLSDSHA